MERDFILSQEIRYGENCRAFFDRIIAKIYENDYITFRYEEGEVITEKDEDGDTNNSYYIEDWECIQEMSIHDFDVAELQALCDYVKTKKDLVKLKVTKK